MPEAQLARRLAGTRERRASQSQEIAALAAAVDPDALAAELARHRLLPLLGRRLLAVHPDVPAPFRARLHDAERAARHRATLVAAAEAGALRALRADGIHALPLKGPRLAEAIHGDPALRWSADVDLLVSCADLVGATEALARAGWSAPHPALLQEVPQLHHVLDHAAGTLPPVEVHWRIHWYEESFSAALLAAGRDGRRPPADLELAALLLFYARDGLSGLRHAADVAAWWDARGHEVAPGALARLAAEHPALAPALAAAARSAGRVAGLPAAVADGLRCGPRAALAVRLANWQLRGSRRQGHADVTLGDVLLAPRGGCAAALRRPLLLSRGAVASHFGVDAESEAARLRQLWWAAGTSARLAPRWPLTLARGVLRQRGSAQLADRRAQR